MDADIRSVERRAAARAQQSERGIGAVVARRPEPGRVEMRISDGTRFGWLVVTTQGEPTDDELVDAVEQRAAALPDDDRLLALEAMSPLAV